VQTVWAAPAIGTLALISIIYAAWVAYHQTDMKLILAYASMSHLGFIVLGIFSLSTIGVLGAVLQIVNSGITTSALFLAVGMIAKRRGGNRTLDEAGGLLGAAPVLGALVLTLAMGSIGLPGLNGFIGEYAVMQGVWLAPQLGWRYALVAVIGVILAAAYMLRMYRGAFFGPARTTEAVDLTRGELLVLLALVVPTVAIGLYPNALLGAMQPGAEGAAQMIDLIAQHAAQLPLR
jgi:NADH-quinone oxidoreductase subunit M